MPRDPSGTYTAPSNSFKPAVNDTIIDPNDWNATLADLSAAMTDSLSRTGQGGMSADLDMNNNDINEIKTAVFQGATSGATTMQATAVAGATTLTLPAATDTLVGKATNDTLTNKSFDTAGTGNSFSINGVAATANTGTGAVARAVSPSFTTPTLGVATATSINGATIDAQLFSNIPQNSQSAAYTTVLTDGQKHIFHPSSDNNARTFTIAANASVAYPIGTAITFVNKINTVTIAINSDTLTLAGTGSTGSRTLAVNGIATAVKIASTEWIISGAGLT